MVAANVGVNGDFSDPVSTDWLELGPSAVTITNGTATVPLDAGDTVRIYAFQNSGVSRALNGQYSHAEMTWVAPKP
jgi:hypothetical protein